MVFAPSHMDHQASRSLCNDSALGWTRLMVRDYLCAELAPLPASLWTTDDRNSILLLSAGNCLCFLWDIVGYGTEFYSSVWLNRGAISFILIFNSLKKVCFNKTQEYFKMICSEVVEQWTRKNNTVQKLHKIYSCWIFYEVEIFLANISYKHAVTYYK